MAVPEDPSETETTETRRPESDSREQAERRKDRRVQYADMALNGLRIVVDLLTKR